MARPRSHSSKLRIRRVVFRITEAEFLRLSHQAARLDKRVNDYARMLTLAGSKSGPSKDAPRHDPALIRQIYHIGHNLNQLVKNAHIFGRVSPRVARLCERIEKLMDEATEKEENQ